MAGGSGGHGRAVALGQLGVLGGGVAAVLGPSLAHRRVAEQEGVFVAAGVVSVGGPGGRSHRGRRPPGGVLVAGGGGGGGRRRGGPGRPSALRPGGREQEGAVVGVLVEVGVGPTRLQRLGRGEGVAAGRGLSEPLLQLLHLLSQALHGVGVVG